ncbi:MAG: C2H2-type zinc finger protein [Candidatus Helarchaeota archaeon]
MYINRRSHGQWCTRRSFETVCPRCGKKVFYWECDHGCKVFFELPLRRPFTKHRCYWKSYSEIKIEMEASLEREYDFRERYSCPVCYKSFKSEKDLRNHLKSMKKQDDDHIAYYRNELIKK